MVFMASTGNEDDKVTREPAPEEAQMSHAAPPLPSVTRGRVVRCGCASRWT